VFFKKYCRQWTQSKEGECVSKLDLSFKTGANIKKNTIRNGYYTFVKPASSSFGRNLFSRVAAVLDDGFDDRKISTRIQNHEKPD
jgi:hypothetical protein